MTKRRYLIGVDEAGYGPNIGPLVISATLWSIPAEYPTEMLWEKLSGVLTNQPQKGDQRLHVADSKEVYQSQKGLHALEHSVLSLASIPLKACPVSKLSEWLKAIHGQIPETFSRQPWYQQTDLDLPTVTIPRQIFEHQQQLTQSLEQAEISLEKIAIDVICPERFNQEVANWGNKSSLLSHDTFSLIRKVMPSLESRIEVRGDKHGGRNRYQEFLSEYFPEQFFLQEKESQQESCYRSGKIMFSFATKSERFLPVALASMVAKYTREICLELFNDYWVSQIPGLKRTKGYPQDAKRFLQDISPVIASSPEIQQVLWRQR